VTFTITIELGNEAMQSYYDIRESIDVGDGGKLMDANGNSVGTWQVS
jgi:hypothetical protein